MNLAALQTARTSPEGVVLADLAVPVGTLGSMLNIQVPDRWAWGDVLEEGAASVWRNSSYRDVRPEGVSSFAASL